MQLHSLLELELSGISMVVSRVKAIASIYGKITDGNCIVYYLTVPSGPPLKFSVVATTPRSLYFSWEPHPP